MEKEAPPWFTEEQSGIQKNCVLWQSGGSDPARAFSMQECSGGVKISTGKLEALSVAKMRVASGMVTEL
jgi:hypothetical protein